jgi:L-cysteine:1D-myo-inositol 2-amino-2-deoxy-alpha-D-glucopyranoside ligase
VKAWAPTYLPPLGPQVSGLPALRIFDSLHLRDDLITEDEVSMYVCGITPYDATHLGHAATYLTFDLINRYLRVRGQNVRYIQNITDVDDPLLERAQRDHVQWEELASDQISLFRDDMTALRVIPPDHYMGAVETIPWVIEAITELQKKGAVYQVDSDLYFDVTTDSQFGSYNQLSDAQQIAIFAERGGDPGRAGKRHPLDCLIWRGQRPGEPSWQSPFGAGRPGWHIECTAIALKYLNAPISIQGGGSDLHFPHHCMCAAEGRVLTGADFARRFVHTGMIALDGEKMSKSRGNLRFVSRMRAEGAEMLTLRVALLSSHYRSDRAWSDELFAHTQERVQRWQVALSSPYGGRVEQLIHDICLCISNDLDTPGAFDLLDRWASERRAALPALTTEDVSSIGTLSRFLDATLGITF